MKVTFKLTKEEAEGFKEFRGAFKPPEITDEQFSKDLFMLGAKIIHHEFLKNMEASKSALETQKQEALNASQDTPQPANPEASGDGS